MRSSPSHIGSGAEHGGVGRGFEVLGTLVGDVEHGGHAVAVARLEATGRELDALHHIGIDDAQSLLLTGTDEERTIDLDAIEVDAVFIERAAAHVVLRGEFVVGTDTGLCSNDFLNAIAGGRGHEVGIHGFDALCSTGLQVLPRDQGFTDCSIDGGQGDVYAYGVGRAAKQAATRFVANHRVDYCYGVGRLTVEGVLAVEVGHGEDALSPHLYGGQLNGAAGIVDYPAEDPASVVLAKGRQGAKRKEQKEGAHYFK